MAKVILSDLRFRINAVKPKKKETNKKVVTTLVRGVVLLVDGVYKVEVVIDKTSSIFDFTEKSFDLKGKENIFTKKKDKTGHYIRIIRPKGTFSLSTYSNTYIPFAPNWVVDGYLVNVDNEVKFDFNNLIAKKGHEYDKGLNYE